MYDHKKSSMNHDIESYKVVGLWLVRFSNSLESHFKEWVGGT